MRYYLIGICANCGKEFNKISCNKINHKKYSHGLCKTCFEIQNEEVTWFGTNKQQIYKDRFNQRNLINFSKELLKTCPDFLLPFMVANIKKYNMQRGL